MTQTNNQLPDESEKIETIHEVTSILPVKSPRSNPGPATDYNSRKVMLRAERKDVIKIVDIEQLFTEGDVPTSLTVVERTNTYFGPELLLEANRQNYLLTAPGPDTQLLLWSEIVNKQEFREAWSRLAEIKATIEEVPQYDICDQCSYPIRSKEHERLSAIGRCPDG